MNEIAILTPYKEQEKYLLDYLPDFKNIYTIDRAQGMEKNVIIISLVKDNVNTLLLKNKPRINVAFTRSKVKLIVIGLYDILSQVEVINSFLLKIRNENRFIELTEDTLL
jgi:DNA replication ATP-dependent helicase Dna2